MNLEDACAEKRGNALWRLQMKRCTRNGLRFGDFSFAGCFADVYQRAAVSLEK